MPQKPVLPVYVVGCVRPPIGLEALERILEFDGLKDLDRCMEMALAATAAVATDDLRTTITLFVEMRNKIDCIGS